MTLELLPPEQYDGELLCPCCGIGRVTGRHFAICVNGYSHEDTCAKHLYSDDLCDPCERSEIGG